MSGAFFQVSGIISNYDAEVVFIWCRNKNPGDDILLEMGHVTGAGGSFLPPGVPAGQFKVTFQLPSGYAAADIFVTDDNGGKVPLPEVTVTPCIVSARLRSGGAASRGHAAHAAANKAFQQPRQIAVAGNGELGS